ncbi:olfactory receptor 14A16-like [Tachyglossus aculeatus]|uniref:olfactory receptor 14A16-like n=1 Tax=Tachyglossus aculeatus TaxID=9261 RepID=UPI0018F60E84|nr:olfactory receptor 14A16-like [Tachyglossus aculeatus]
MQLVHVARFLLVYLGSLTENLLTVAVSAFDQRLHTPTSSGTCPSSTLLDLRHELLVLTAMSYDRYATIFLHLGYEGVMNRVASPTFYLSFRGSNIVQQFFCDVPSLLKINCPENHFAVDVSVTAEVALGVIRFILIIVSYVHILRAMLELLAPESAFVYIKLPSESSLIVVLLVSVFYAVVPPPLNPPIYSLRNRGMKASMSRILNESLTRPPFWDKKCPS